jgi:ankyrin repeat protein
MASELISACKQNDIGRVKELLDHGADPNLQVDEFGRTALVQTVYHGHTDIVRELLVHEADPNLQTSKGSTALIRAVFDGSTDMVRLLLDHGADPNLQCPGSNSALLWASCLYNPDVVKLLEAACWNWNVVQPMEELDIFPEGLIREHLTV